VPLHRYLLNGVIVTAAIFTLQVLVALPAAYALAKLRFGMAKPLFALVLLGLLIPGHVPAIPHYIMLSQAGLLNSYPALIMPSIISVFGIFWIRQFFRTIPDDLIHAARLDGLSEFSIVWRIMLPAAMPALFAFGIALVRSTNGRRAYWWRLVAVTIPACMFLSGLRAGVLALLTILLAVLGSRSRARVSLPRMGALLIEARDQLIDAPRDRMTHRVDH